MDKEINTVVIIGILAREKERGEEWKEGRKKEREEVRKGRRKKERKE